MIQIKRKPLLSIIIITAGAFLLFLFNTSPNKIPESESMVVSREAQEIAEDCKGLENREQCYAKAFENLTKTGNRTHSFDVLRELQKTDHDARGCHFIAHAISNAETQKDPSKWRELMNSAPPDCSYGAAHGSLEVYASTFQDGKIPKNEISYICNNPDTNNCTHILGHLILVMNENNLDESVASCQSLPHDYFGKFECLTGVFMERSTALNLVTHGLATQDALNWAVKLPETEKLCRNQKGVPSIACWKETVHVALVKFNNDPQKIIDFCESAPEADETRECIDHSLGVIAGAYNFELESMYPICNSKTKDVHFRERCYANLVGATISTVPQELPSAIKFCSDINPEYQESCFIMIGNSLRTRPEYKSMLISECAFAPEKFREGCLSGGNSGIKLQTGD